MSQEQQGCVWNGGCLGLILSVILIWALCFGVTWNGRHHGISSCNCDKGVVFE